MGTRRCTQRELLLRPDALLNQILGYALGYAQAKHKFSLHYFIAMSNHHHSGLSDPGMQSTHSNTPDFMRDFHALAARAINRLRGRRGNLWSGGGSTYNFVRSDDTDDMIQRYVYGLHNPVEGELVSSYKKWPGLILTPGPSGRRVYRFKRPALFFSEKMPEWVEVVVEAPQCELTPREFMKRVHERLNVAEKNKQAEMRVKGRKWLGVKAVLRQSPTSRPRTYEPRRQGKPQIATSDRWRRLEQIQQNREFLIEYERCRDLFRSGDTDVVFPIGTFKLVAYYGARSSPGPEPPGPLRS